MWNVGSIAVAVCVVSSTAQFASGQFVSFAGDESAHLLFENAAGNGLGLENFDSFGDGTNVTSLPGLVDDDRDIAGFVNAALAAGGAGTACPPPGMLFIPAGDFQMGDHDDFGLANELPVHTVYIDAFYVDKFEITNQQYADALNWALAQGNQITINNGEVQKVDGAFTYCHTTSSQSGSHITWNDASFGVVAGKENFPMFLVTWYGAAVYSNWRSEMRGLTPSYDTTTWSCDFAASGYRLPTEAEWEKAARGGQYAPYYTYPWGDVISGANANFALSGDPYGGTTPVGYYSGGQTPPGSDMRNGYGLYDMAGNVWEFCNDWIQADYYSSSPTNNPRGPNGGISRVRRGGSLFSPVDDLRCSRRSGLQPERSTRQDGFRLVLDFVASQDAPGDLDHDGDVDLVDHALFVDCFSGVDNGPVGNECCGADFNNDGDVDLQDWAWFQQAFDSIRN